MTENESKLSDRIKEKQEEQKEKGMSSLHMILKDAKKTELADNVPSPWKVSERQRKNISKGVAMFNTSFGLYAAIPMLCKGEECPYATLFPELHEGGMEDGERCPVEVSFVMSKYKSYIDELGIEEEDAVDMSLLRDLIDCDVQILRADNKIALEGGFTEQQVVAVGDNGKAVYREEITATANYKDKVQSKRNRTLELLNSTRKDKAGTKINMTMDPSSYAASLLKKVSDSKQVDITEYEVIEDVPYMKELEKNRLNKPNYGNASTYSSED